MAFPWQPDGRQTERSTVTQGPPRELGRRVVSESYDHELRRHVTVERTVEVPQVVVQEHIRYVPVPEIVERLIEVPRVRTVEREVQLPPTRRRIERLVEVPQTHTEDFVVHRPQRIVQERIIEVPKPVFVENVEYDDRIEYREVPVDRIVEVPEVEYRLVEVPHYIPQMYVQEYHVDRRVDVPMQQVQEVHRQEHVPIYNFGEQRASGPGCQTPPAPLAATFSSETYHGRPSATAPCAAPPPRMCWPGPAMRAPWPSHS